MKYLSGTVLFLFLASTAIGAPPSVDVPTEIVASGDFTIVSPKTDAKAISYVGLSGVDPFPSVFLKDSKVFVLPTRGLTTGVYEFAGVASANDEHTVFRFKVRVGPSVVVPPVDPPTQPAGLYFMIVRADGPAAPSFTTLMSHPGWAVVRGRGHSVKDFTLSDARRLGATVPAGPLPVVIVLRVEGNTSRVIRPASPVPSDPVKLLE